MNGRCDVAIIGGGMTGAALAAALAGGPLRVAVVEAEAFDAPGQVSFDRRTVALTYSSRWIFSAMGAWPGIAKTACPIHRIEVSQRGWPGAARLHCRDAGKDALG
ncbi:MAG: 2-octaprenyl-6-methoxyphenyl hydroxylase, partial [Gammaproteobacteria bacterium]|nr:2-octaprenyl-6-methoxyphenyl hydroxylase [Gammaproteobacteria bacterium]